MSILWTVLYGILFVVIYGLLWGLWKNGHFKRRGVKCPTSYLPFVGNVGHALTQTKHFKEFLDEMYRENSKERYFGFMQFTTPIVVLRDVEIIKQICVKDFDHFLDHQGTLGDSGDLLFGRGLFTLRGQKWRDMRSTLSPAFTSSKMKGMFQFVVECGEQTVDYYMQQMNEETNKVRGLIELEMKDVFTRYTNDVIATCAFGLKTNSLIDKKNQFYLMGKEATDFSGMNVIRFIFMMVFPTISKMFKVKFLSKQVSDFFRNLVWDTIKDREDRNILRNDMIQILMEAKKGTLKHDSNEDGKEAGFATVEESDVGKTTVKREWDDDDIVGQAVSFFVAGFDTASILVCFIVHELAFNPEIQRKLQDEVDEVAANLEGKLTYDCLQKMKYFDMVVSETLRKWPPALATDRNCIKPYTLPPPNDSVSEGLTMDVNDGILIPTYSIHHDPDYYKDPEVFDPERFSDENKHNIKAGTYMPFGIGPRNCIGSRFALMEAKVVIYSLLLKFNFVTTAKTPTEIKLKTNTFNFQIEKGFWVGLIPRAK